MYTKAAMIIKQGGTHAATAVTQGTAISTKATLHAAKTAEAEAITHAAMVVNKAVVTTQASVKTQEVVTIAMPFARPNAMLSTATANTSISKQYQHKS